MQTVQELTTNLFSHFFFFLRTAKMEYPKADPGKINYGLVPRI